MNVFLKNQVRKHGGVLIVALLLCVILGVLLGSYLSLIQNQHLSVARAQAWNAALVVAEAGVEEAMAHLNSGVTTNNLAVNSWTAIGGGVYQKTNFLGSSYSMVQIKIGPAVTNADPVVVSTAYVPGPISRPTLSRSVQVTTRPKSVNGPPGGMVVTTTVNLNGNGIYIDSFDSSDPNYSTGGAYDRNKARDHAEVTTLSSVSNAISIDNGKIKGLVRTGPGGQVSVGSNGSVGDSAWVDTNTKGVENGHLKNDANFTLSDVGLPSGVVWMPPLPGNYRINGQTYKYVLNKSGAYKLPTLDGSVYISAPGVALYLTDSFSFGGQVRVAPGGDLTMYVASPSVNLSGQGFMNDTGLAKNFTYYGLPSNTSLNISANAALVGSIYAPNAVFTLGGGGNDNYDFAGACVVKSVSMNGHFNFHYDESLVRVPAISGYAVTSWDEL